MLRQTAQHLQNQEQVARAFGAVFNCDMRPRAALDQIDYDIYLMPTVQQRMDGMQPERAGLAEVKCRSHEIGRYATFMLDERKVKAGLALTPFHLRFLLIVSFAGEIHWLNVSKNQYRTVVLGGRRDRNDPLDTDPVAHFQTKLFRPLIEV